MTPPPFNLRPAALSVRLVLPMRRPELVTHSAQSAGDGCQPGRYVVVLAEWLQAWRSL